MSWYKYDKELKRTRYMYMFRCKFLAFCYLIVTGIAQFISYSPAITFLYHSCQHKQQQWKKLAMGPCAECQHLEI